tara:strand:+ start:951 stop:2054 length:1104 start_codon:yes stop_codon:yes gene_type:complete
MKYQVKNKILIVSSEFPPGPGGIGNHAFNLSFELNKRGHEVVINTISDYVTEDKASVFDEKLPYKVYRFKRYKNTLLTWIFRLSTIKNTIDKYKIKKVFISGRFSIWIIPFLKIYGNIKIITVVHGTELGKSMFLKWTLFCLEKSNFIVSVSRFTRELIPEKLRSKTYVINNGVSLGKWKNVPNSHNLKNYPILVTVGTISKRKGQFNVLKTLPDIIKEFPRTHYHCIGNNEQGKQLITIAKNLNLTDKITIHGFLGHSELEKIYNVSHVNMMLADNESTSDFEGFGISVLEGNIYGLPTIGSKHTGLEDSINNNYNGKLVNPNNKKEIVESLKKIFDNYYQYANFSKAHAKKNNWGNSILQYEKFI